MYTFRLLTNGLTKCSSQCLIASDSKHPSLLGKSLVKELNVMSFKSIAESGPTMYVSCKN